MPDKEYTTTGDIVPTEPAVEQEATPTVINPIKTAAAIINSDTPDEYIAASGIDILEVYRELGRIALSSESYVRDKYGDIHSLGPDNKSRLPAIQMILELKKHLKDKSVVTQVGIFSDPEITKRAERIIAGRHGA